MNRTLFTFTIFFFFISFFLFPQKTKAEGILGYYPLNQSLVDKANELMDGNPYIFYTKNIPLGKNNWVLKPINPGKLVNGKIPLILTIEDIIDQPSGINIPLHNIESYNIPTIFYYPDYGFYAFLCNPANLRFVQQKNIKCYDALNEAVGNEYAIPQSSQIPLGQGLGINYDNPIRFDKIVYSNRDLFISKIWLNNGNYNNYTMATTVPSGIFDQIDIYSDDLNGPGTGLVIYNQGYLYQPISESIENPFFKKYPIKLKYHNSYREGERFLYLHAFDQCVLNWDGHSTGDFDLNCEGMYVEDSGNFAGPYLPLFSNGELSVNCTKNCHIKYTIDDVNKVCKNVVYSSHPIKLPSGVTICGSSENSVVDFLAPELEDVIKFNPDDYDWGAFNWFKEAIGWFVGIINKILKWFYNLWRGLLRVLIPNDGFFEAFAGKIYSKVMSRIDGIDLNSLKALVNVQQRELEDVYINFPQLGLEQVKIVDFSIIRENLGPAFIPYARYVMILLTFSASLTFVWKMFNSN